MNILAADEIEFEISFRPESKGYAATANGLGEDYVVCKLTQDTDDERFWTADISAGYYTCVNGVNTVDYGLGVGDYCGGGVDSYSSKFAETQDDIQWAVDVDDADDETSFWCTHAGSKDTWSPYACTAIECPIWRDLDTLDPTEDLSFNTNGDDVMNIKIGRAALFVNSSTYNYAARGPLAENLRINVW